ncbi:hypothetical protein ACS0TY_023840 [Phlomoides rotata]
MKEDDYLFSSTSTNYGMYNGKMNALTRMDLDYKGDNELEEEELLALLYGIFDEDCINHLRRSRGVFSRLCYLLETSGGLQSTRNCTIAEQVAMFLSILAHHTKNCIVKSNHIRSGQTVSKHFHRVLNSIIMLHSILLSQPKSIDENGTDERWKHFKTYPHAKCMKNKSFPFYKEWIDIFGKDKTTEEFGEDYKVADGDPINEGHGKNGNDEIKATTDENEFSVPTNLGQGTSGKKMKSKKRQIDESIRDRMVEMMGKFCEQTNENLQVIGKRIGYEVSLGEKREKLFEALGKLERPSLFLAERIM